MFMIHAVSFSQNLLGKKFSRSNIDTCILVLDSYQRNLWSSCYISQIYEFALCNKVFLHWIYLKRTEKEKKRAMKFWYWKLKKLINMIYTYIEIICTLYDILSEETKDAASLPTMCHLWFRSEQWYLPLACWYAAMRRTHTSIKSDFNQFVSRKLHDYFDNFHIF